MKIRIIILIINAFFILVIESIKIPKNAFVEPGIEIPVLPKNNNNEITQYNDIEELNSYNHIEKADFMDSIAKETVGNVDPMKEINDFFINNKEIQEKKNEIIQKYQNITKNSVKPTKNNDSLHNNVSHEKDKVNIIEDFSKFNFKQKTKKDEVMKKEIANNDGIYNNKEKDELYISSSNKVDSLSIENMIDIDDLKSLFDKSSSSLKSMNKLLSENTKKFSDFLLNHEKLDSLLKDQTNIENDNKKIEASNEFINRILSSLSNNQQIISSSTSELSILSSNLRNISQFLQGKEETLQNDLENEKMNKINNKIELNNALNKITSQLNKEKENFNLLQKQKIENIEKIKDLFKNLTKEEIIYSNKVKEINEQKVKNIQAKEEINNLNNKLIEIKNKNLDKIEKIEILQSQLKSLQNYYNYLKEDIDRIQREKEINERETLEQLKSLENEKNNYQMKLQRLKHSLSNDNFGFKQTNNNDLGSYDDMKLTKKILNLIKQNYHNPN